MNQDPAAPESPITVEDLLRESAERLQGSGAFFGHGTDNAMDEAALLVFHSLGLDHGDAGDSYAQPVGADALARVRDLVACRIETRMPSAYLVGEAWFAGLRFKVDQRVLVPRSPLAELIMDRFEPWIDSGRVESILDLCTGSGCIGIAAALEFPHASVDLSDISEGALQVALDNVSSYGLEGRVRLLHGDLFAPLDGCSYDVIVSNPPYVAEQEYASLPGEYGHEPGLGLVAGPDGLDIVHKILQRAAAYLEPGGILVVEVGSAQQALERAYPHTPFTWLEFEFGGSGVFTLTRDELLTLERPKASEMQECDDGR